MLDIWRTKEINRETSATLGNTFHLKPTCFLSNFPSNPFTVVPWGFFLDRVKSSGVKQSKMLKIENQDYERVKAKSGLEAKLYRVYLPVLTTIERMSLLIDNGPPSGITQLMLSASDIITPRISSNPFSISRKWSVWYFGRFFQTTE